MTPPVHRASGWRSVWAAAAVTAAIAVCAAGIARTGVFRHMPWTPSGLHRFLLYSSGFAVYCGLCYLTRRDLLVAAAAAGATAYTVALVGWQGPVAILLFAAGSYGAGTWLFGLFGLKEERATAAIPVAAGVALWTFVCGLLAFSHFNLGWIYIGLLAVPAVFHFRRLARMVDDSLRSLRSELESRAGFWSAALLGYVLGAQWLMCLKPEVSADGIAMHLAVPMHMAKWHGWHFDVTRTSLAVMPMGADWCSSMLYGIGGEYAAKLLPLFFLAVTLVLLFAMCRRWVSAPVALSISAVYAATPLVQLTTGSLFAENLLVLLLLAAVYAILEAEHSRQPAWLAVAAMMLGAAMSVKFGAIAFVVPCAVWMLSTAYGLRQVSGVARHVALAAGLFAVLACPSYFTAFLKTGNPVFPFLNTVFRSPYFATSTNNPDPRFAAPLAWRTPFDLTFHTSRYLEGGDGAIGFVYLFVLVLLLCGMGVFRGAGVWKPLAVSVAFFVLTWRGVSYARYALPALPLILVASSSAVAVLRDLDRRLYAVVLSALTLLTVAGAWLLPVSGYWHHEFCLNPLRFRQESNEYIERHAPSRILVERLNLEAPGQPVAFLTNGIAGLDAPAYIVGWHDFTFYRELREARTPAEVAEIVRQKGIRHFVACLPPCDPPLPAPVKEFMRTYTREQCRAGGAYVAELP